MNYIFVAIISYIIGSFSGSYVLGKAIYKIDIRKYGSGNAGATNALRVKGKKFGISAFILDFLKGLFCMYVINKCFDKGLLSYSMLFCVIGHDFPFYMNFKGGKGVATTVGCLCLIHFPIALIVCTIWIFVFAITRMASLASISIFITGIVLSITWGQSFNLSLYCQILTMLLGIFRHKANIVRILNGTEGKIGVKK